MTHPNSLALEAFACGERRAEVAKHLADCVDCTRFVEKLTALPAPSAERIDSLLDRATARAESANDGEVLLRRRLFAVSSAVVPLAMAAVLVFVLRPTTPRLDGETPASSPTLIGSRDSKEPGTSFKGGVQVAVVRERHGHQDRMAGPLRVEPGDRLRVEVALDREQAILAGVMGDDGSWLELVPPGVHSPGTFFSERSARVDASPTDGTILVGSPDAVQHARTTKDLSGLTAIHLTWEAAP